MRADVVQKNTSITSYWMLAKSKRAFIMWTEGNIAQRQNKSTPKACSFEGWKGQVKGNAWSQINAITRSSVGENCIETESLLPANHLFPLPVWQSAFVPCRSYNCIQFAYLLLYRYVWLFWELASGFVHFICSRLLNADLTSSLRILYYRQCIHNCCRCII